MTQRTEHVGQRIGRLTVTARAPNHVQPSGVVRTMYAARCDCGMVVTVRGADLSSGNTRSCGCLAREIIVNRNRSRAKPKIAVEAKRDRFSNKQARLYVTKAVMPDVIPRDALEAVIFGA